MGLREKEKRCIPFSISEGREEGHNSEQVAEGTHD